MMPPIIATALISVDSRSCGFFTDCGAGACCGMLADAAATGAAAGASTGVGAGAVDGIGTLNVCGAVDAPRKHSNWVRASRNARSAMSSRRRASSNCALLMSGLWLMPNIYPKTRECAAQTTLVVALHIGSIIR